MLGRPGRAHLPVPLPRGPRAPRLTAAGGAPAPGAVPAPGYRALLREPGALAFVLAALVGRTPIAMYGLGTIILVEARTGSYARAGAVAGAFGVTSLLAPVHGRLADRHGQTRVLPPVLAAHVVGLLLLVAAGQASAPLGLQVLAALAAGATMPQLGAYVRTRWAVLLEGRPGLQRAFALESALDELVFIGGPVVVTVLAAAVTPAAGLLTALVLVTAGATAFALLRSTAPPPAVGGGHHAGVWSGALRVLVVVFAAVGVAFGSLEVSVVAFADARERPVLAGPLLALVALASGLAGLAYGSRGPGGDPVHRLRGAVLALAVGLLPLALVDAPVLKAVAALVAGVAIAPTLIVGYATVERVVPARALSEGFAWVNAAIGCGAALGAAGAGVLVDAGGSRAGFLLMAAAGAGAVVAVVTGGRDLGGRATGAPDAR